MKLRSLSENEVQVTFTDEDYFNDGVHIRKYWAPEYGGYVFDVTHKPGTLGQQITDRKGHCVSWTPKQGLLINIVRRWAKKK